MIAHRLVLKDSYRRFIATLNHLKQTSFPVYITVWEMIKFKIKKLKLNLEILKAKIRLRNSSMMQYYC